MKKVAYIAGAITGQENYREKFAEAEKALSAAGYIVLNPKVLPEGLTPAEYMRICMAMVDVADTIMLQLNWLFSRGACLELRYAEYTGKTVLYWRACSTCRGYDFVSKTCRNRKSPRFDVFQEDDDECSCWELRGLAP